jgi:hypothetical protein
MRYLGASLALLVAISGSALAQRSPASLWGEGFLAAEVGAVIGGAIGLGTVHTACIRVERSCDPLYKIVVLQQRLPIEDDLFSVIRLNSPGFHTVNMGRGIGALAGGGVGRLSARCGREHLGGVSRDASVGGGQPALLSLKVSTGAGSRRDSGLQLGGQAQIPQSLSRVEHHSSL